MNLDAQAFTVHDIRQFPFVIFNAEAAQPGYSALWEKEISALMANGEPFVIVYDQLRSEDSHEDRKHRGIWLKHNKTALARVCKGLISIEPDPEVRAQRQAQGEIAVKAFGIAHAAVASREEALALALRWIGQ